MVFSSLKKEIIFIRPPPSRTRPIRDALASPSVNASDIAISLTTISGMPGGGVNFVLLMAISKRH